MGHVSTSCQSGSFEVGLRKEPQPSIKVGSKSLKGKFVKERIKYGVYAVIFFHGQRSVLRAITFSTVSDCM